MATDRALDVPAPEHALKRVALRDRDAVLPLVNEGLHSMEAGSELGNSVVVRPALEGRVGMMRDG